MKQMECGSASEKEPALPDSTGESDRGKKLRKGEQDAEVWVKI